MFGELPFGEEAFGAAQEPTPIDNTQMFLQDLLSRRNVNKFGGDCVWFLELSGAKIVEPTAFEPDPNTHRSDYYYNAIENVMYTKRRVTDNTYIWTRMR